MQKILFVAGGSVGHTAPAVAIWRAWHGTHADSQTLFICADREDEKEFLTSEHLSFTALPLPRFGILFPWTWVRNLLRSVSILRSYKPDLVFSKGGNLSLPVCLCAWLLRIPIVLHESDAVLGRANSIVQYLAHAVCLGMHATNYPLQATHYYTGNPIRPVVTSGSKQEALRITGLSGTKPVLLIMGGSQGAMALNQIVWKLLPEILKQYEVVHITGRGKQSDANSQLSIANSQYWSTEFATNELPHLYALADVALSRAGAGSISELRACGIPSILVPLMGVAHTHQDKNAQAAEAEGGFIMIFQEDLEESLLSELENLQLTTYNLQPNKDPALQICQVMEQILAQ